MRLPGSTRAGAQFAIPEVAVPEAVQAAKDEFDAVGDRLRDAASELIEARHAVKDARLDDRQAAADAYRAGETPTAKQLDSRQRAAEAKLAQLEERIAALDQAVDQAGDALAFAIEEARDDWLASLDAARADAMAAYSKALKAASAAASDLRDCHGGSAWLSAFDAPDATIAAQTQYAGGRLYVSRPGPGDSQVEVEELLSLVGEVAAPPVEASPAGVVVGGKASGVEAVLASMGDTVARSHGGAGRE